MSSDRHSRTQSVTLKRQCLFVLSWRIFRNWWKFKLTAKQNHLIYFFPSHQDRQSFEGHGYVFINVGTFVKKQLLGTSKCAFFIVLTTIASYFCDSIVTTRGTSCANVWGCKDEWQAVFLYCVWDISHSALGVWCSCFSLVFRVSARIEYECVCVSLWPSQNLCLHGCCPVFKTVCRLSSVDLSLCVCVFVCGYPYEAWT